MSNLFDLSGKVAVITGSTKGIGKAIAEHMAAAGARVVISSRKAQPCAEVAAAIRARGAEAIGFACNVSHPDQLQTLVERTHEAFGGIDVLVCNAAVNPYFGPLLDIDDGAWDKTMTVNVKNNMRLCGLVMPGMVERGGGAIIFISSIAGLKGSSRLGAYAISKVADMQLARNLALEWGHANVRVNCIAPGLVKTDMARVLWEGADQHRKALAAYPIGRLGEPEDIAGAAVFLASPAGSWMTGQTLVVDGGSTITSGDYS